MYNVSMNNLMNRQNLLNSFTGGTKSVSSSPFDYASMNNSKLDKILSKRVAYESKQTQEVNDFRKSSKEFYGDFYPQMAELKDAAAKLKNTSVSSTLNPTGYGSENSNAVSNVTGTLESGEAIEVKVSQIAAGAKTAFEGIDAKGKNLFDGTSKISIKTGGKTSNVDISIKAGTSNSDALTAIADKINSAKLGVTAKVSTKDGKSSIEMVSDKTGESSSLFVSVQGAAKKGLGEGISTDGQNAKYTVKGTEFTSESNRISLEGGKVGATLTGAGTAKLSKKTVDTKSIISSLNDFAKSYNETIDFLNSNKSKSTGINNLAQSFSDNRFASKALSEVGINVNFSSGKLSIDEKAFEKAYKDDPAMVKKIIGSSGGLAGSTFEKVSNAVASSSKLMQIPNGNRGNFYGTQVGVLMDTWA